MPDTEYISLVLKLKPKINSIFLIIYMHMQHTEALY